MKLLEVTNTYKTYKVNHNRRTVLKRAKNWNNMTFLTFTGKEREKASHNNGNPITIIRGQSQLSENPRLSLIKPYLAIISSQLNTLYLLIKLHFYHRKIKLFISFSIPLLSTGTPVKIENSVKPNMGDSFKFTMFSMDLKPSS